MELQMGELFNKPKAFSLFDRIRKGDLTEYDEIILLKDYTQNYDIELLKSLASDISFYIYLYKEEKESTYETEDIENAIEERKKKGLDIPYIKMREPKELTDSQKKKIENFGIKFDSLIDVEALLFPYEFYNVRRFQLKIDTKIDEVQNKISVLNTNIKFNINPTELIELTKSLIENGNVIGKQKDIINSFSSFFNTEIKNPSKTITDLSDRNNGSETLFLDKLKKTLLNYFLVQSEKKKR